jgi:WD40 repeat protein
MSGARAALIGGASVTLDDFPVAMAWTADSAALIVGGGEGRIHRIDAPPGAAAATVATLGEHAPGVLELALQPKGTALITTGQDGGVQRRELGNSASPSSGPDTSAAGASVESQVVHRSPRWPAGLAFRADGSAFAIASGKDVLVFDANGKPLREIGGHSVPLSHVVWRGRDELIAVGNGALFVDRADNGAVEQFVLEGTPQTLALSPDLKIAVCGLADGSINFRYINNRKRSRMSGYEGKVDQTCFSANSRYLATASTGASSLVMWDFGGKGPEGGAPQQLQAHEERIVSLAWQPAGALLASAGKDWRVVLWRPGPKASTAEDIQLLDGPAGMISWSPDGKRLAVAQPSGKVRLFSLRAA